MHSQVEPCTRGCHSHTDSIHITEQQHPGTQEETRPQDPHPPTQHSLQALGSLSSQTYICSCLLWRSFPNGLKGWSETTNVLCWCMCTWKRHSSKQVYMCHPPPPAKQFTNGPIHIHNSMKSLLSLRLELGTRNAYSNLWPPGQIWPTACFCK